MNNWRRVSAARTSPIERKNNQSFASHFASAAWINRRKRFILLTLLMHAKEKAQSPGYCIQSAEPSAFVEAIALGLRLPLFLRREIN
jgi:hypothetical protein